MNRLVSGAVVTLALLLAGAAAGREMTHHTAPDAAVKVDFAAAIPNIPGKSLKTVLVSYPPGGRSPAHTHAKSAFILARVLEGEVVSGVNGQPPRTYHVGETWTENPGDHHTASYNPSKTRPATLLATFVVDTNDTQLTTNDPH
jgi:quercetin dioxygenase-like cupin family protein